MENKRKIIEIYVTENKEENTISFEFEKIEDSDVANNTMKMLVYIFQKYKDKDDELEINGKLKEEKERCLNFLKK